MRLIAFALAVLAFPGTSLASTCGPWVPQTNGTSWRICADLQSGGKYCELKRRSTIQRISCP